MTKKEIKGPTLISRSVLDMGRILASVASLLFLAMPLVSFAVLRTPRFDTVIGNYVGGLRVAGGLLVAFGVLFLVIGIFRYINAGDDPARLAEAGKLIMWGSISIFVMLTFWGFASILVKTLFPHEAVNSFTPDNRLWDSNIP